MLYFIILPAVILLSIFASYTDIKEGKIRNKHLLYYLAFLVFLLLIYYSFLAFKGTFNPMHLVFILINTAAAFILGILLWLTGFWTAGDAKLYASLSFGISFAFSDSFSGSSFSGYPFIIILVCSFAPFFFFFAAKVIFSIKIPELKKVLKSRFSPDLLSLLLLTIFCVGWIIVFFPILSSQPILYFAVIFFAYIILGGFGVKWMKYVLIIIAVLRLVFDSSVFTFSYFWKFLLLSAVMIALQLIYSAGFYSFTKEIKIGKLKVGMVAAENITLLKGQYAKEDMPVLSKPGFVPATAGKKSYLFENRTAGFSSQEIEKLKILAKQKKLSFNSIRVNETVPFAPFMSAGALFFIIYTLLLW